MARRSLSEAAALRQGWICEESRPNMSADPRDSSTLQARRASHGAGGGALQILVVLTTRSGRRRPSFSVPRLRRGVHRPAAAALRSGAVDGVEAKAVLPRLRWRGSSQPGGAWSEDRSLRARLRGRMFISG